MSAGAATSPLWESAWRAQRPGTPALLGGDYDPDVLAKAYSNGYFPMVMHDASRVRMRMRLARARIPKLPGTADPYTLTWWAPVVRPVIVRSTVRAGRRLRQTLRGSGWTSTMDADFAGVVRRCGPERGEESWLSDELVEAYLGLHARGQCHSVEVWEGDEMVAGAFGTMAGGVFCGDSAFRERDNGAKVAILDLTQRLMDGGVVMIDCQDSRNGLHAIGSVPVRIDDYREVLARTRDWWPVPTVEERPVDRLVAWVAAQSSQTQPTQNRSATTRSVSGTD